MISPIKQRGVHLTSNIADVESLVESPDEFSTGIGSKGDLEHADVLAGMAIGRNGGPERRILPADRTKSRPEVVVPGTFCTRFLHLSHFGAEKRHPLLLKMPSGSPRSSDVSGLFVNKM
jgi:hypothetical protein